MKDHPIAEIFPLMDDGDLQALSDDIKENGQRAPINIYEGKILDGRNRFRACKLAKIEPKTREFTGKDALEFVLSANLHRRHLTTSQRAMVAANIANLKHGGDRGKPSYEGVSVARAAASMNVGESSVERAKTVLSEAPKSVVQQVMNGSKTVTTAVKEIRKAASEPEVPRDDTGYKIPPKILPLWNRKSEVEDILRAISKARCAVKEASEKEDALYQPVNLNSILATLNRAYTEMQVAVPYAVCATCQGQATGTCNACKGRGLVSKHHFDRTVPDELKAIRAKSCVTK